MVWILQKVIDATLVAVFLVVMSLAYQVYFDAPYILLAAISFLITPPLFQATGLYYSFRGDHPAAEYPKIFLGWVIEVLILLILGYLTKTSEHFSRLLITTWLLVTPLGICCFHLMVRMMLRQLRASGHNTRKAVIAGTNELAGYLAQELNQSPELGIQFCGFFTDQSCLESGRPWRQPLIGTLSELPNYIQRFKIDVVYIALQLTEEEGISKLMYALQDTTACVYFVPNLLTFNLLHARVHELHGIPVLAIWETPFDALQGSMKRITDIIVALLVLVLTSPLMAAIALAVKLSSPGSILFVQRRYGLSGTEIPVYKFRSMRVTEDGADIPQAQQNDPRVTPIGAFLRRTSLDELPQFINVLQGHMSIVGPRPHAVAHNEHYRKLIQGYMLRHIVKPGITGWAQIHGLRGETETLDKMERRVAYDLHYLRHWSLWLDLVIIVRTIMVVFKHQNAY
ncbi:undecaprenyl-phosphate glucose phosphotransferase [Synechococcales cyanobacterium C]|uniref:Undecaprenyl-phosphate glucose phosphotransferase n=1 Tax=Petrachloros mirabilis ULC683 TaxID=2781853 RepID=A0A8K2A804_9CYAN|nr:undecaprenyl-phosphate glucose phosphotransferase [Petrachloros mirabilis]NCJ07461.1 undecaprenyl-phosphate glucose phosphotransferase [Petrachloros mirabilis ULC683]